MGDIGRKGRRIHFEPLDEPGVPEPERRAPVSVPASPARVPEPAGAPQ